MVVSYRSTVEMLAVSSRGDEAAAQSTTLLDGGSSLDSSTVVSCRASSTTGWTLSPLAATLVALASNDSCVLIDNVDDDFDNVGGLSMRCS